MKHVFNKPMLLLLLFFISGVSFAQEIKISGTVKDKEGFSLPGANIVIKGAVSGTQTDFDGNYSIDVSKGSTLVFSYIGFLTVERIVGDDSIIDVKLQEDAAKLDEVVVIGYGVQKKSDLTGAVSSLKAKDFNKGLNTSPEQLFMGKTAGVRVVQSGGEPGAGISINVRGSSSISAGTEPLYVLDGLPLQNEAAVSSGGPGFSSSFAARSPLSTINPQDIASIDILKDASATAIYGSRGANGVVLITTKSGTSGKLKVNYDYNVGAQSPSRHPTLLTPQQYMNTINALIDEGVVAPRVASISNGGTDWQEELFNKSAIFQSHNLSFSGGDQRTKYLVSLSALNQPGILINSSLNRYSGRINVDHNISKKFNLGARISTTHNKDQYIANGTGFNASTGSVNAALNFDPTLSVFDENGIYTTSPYLSIDNPLAIANGFDSYGNRYQTIANIFTEFFIIPELSAKINIGVDNYEEQRKTYISRIAEFGLASGGIANILEGHRSNYLTEATVNYHNSFGKNTLDVLGGISYQKFTNDNSVATGKNFPSDVTGAENLGLGDPTLASNSSFKSNNTLLSYIGRANYTIQDKYLLTATMRIDGSSRFGANNKFALFPSFAAGWKISEEQFFSPLSETISTFKLRSSWGRTGNQDIGNYKSISTYVAGQPAVMDDQLTTTIIPSGLPNPDIKWETTQQFDIGLDFGILKGRITGSIDYYQKNTYDLLIDLPLDLTTGFNTQLRNIGEIKNNGFEFTVVSHNLTKKLKWTTEINLSTMKNEVMDIGPLSEIIAGNSIIRVGSPLRSFYGYKVVGTWQTDDDLSSMLDNLQPGDPKYLDVNGDRRITTEDRVVLGNSFPKLSFGINNTFSFNNFDFNFFFDGVTGVKKYDSNLANALIPADVRRNRFAVPFLNKWTVNNPTNEWPSFVRQQGTRNPSSYSVRDASYLRLSTVQLSYNFPSGSIGTWFRNFKIYATAQNVFVISDYLGDPTMNTGGNANFGVSTNPYPLAKTFLFGINVDL